MKLLGASCLTACLIFGYGKAMSTTPPDDARTDGITSVVMHRSACYGACPVYTVQLLSSGDLRFDGEQHVKAAGRQISRITAKDFALLVKTIESVDFFNLRDHYESQSDGCVEWMTDNPTVDITVTRAGTQKSVSFYYGCLGLSVSQHIVSLSDTIDHLANTKRWVR